MPENEKPGRGNEEIIKKLTDLGGKRELVEVQPGLYVVKNSPPAIWDIDYYAPAAWIPRKEEEAGSSDVPVPAS